MTTQPETPMFSGSIAQVYARHLVPLLFEPYATSLVEHVRALAPTRVLELAAGTGVVTRALVRALPHSTFVVTDLHQPMLDEAMRSLSSKQVEWRQADALALSMREATFDAVVCQFGVMFFTPRVQAFREAWRVLRPQGHFVFNTWQSVEHNELAQEVGRALAVEYPNDTPRFMQLVPHGYGDPVQIERDLREAGFEHVRLETVALQTPPTSARAAALAYCQGTPLRNEIERRSPNGLEAVTSRVEAALAAKFGRAEAQTHLGAISVVATK